MRLLDADILAYALYDNSPAHPPAWKYVENCLQNNLILYVTPTTVLETYNTLFWYYKVRPIRALIQKLSLILDTFQIVDTSINGLSISASENIPLGDGLLISTAIENNLPILVSNDKHITENVSKYGLINENPIPKEILDSLSKWNP